jgi:hypothetical protein
MTFRSRAIRIALPEARGQLANTVLELVNISRTGALIRSGYELLPGTVWPFVLELTTETVNLTARVVRCRPTEASFESAAARIRYDIGIIFDVPSSAAQRTLQQLCGTAMEPDDRRSQPSQGGLR